MLVDRTIKDGNCNILPQYLANLAQPIGTKQAKYFGEIHPCTNNIVYGRCGIVRIGKFIPVLTTLCMVGLELLELGNSSLY